MNWEAIGALSDFAGAAAVVITLVYLSVQVREAQKTSKSHATITATNLASKWRTNLIQDQYLAEIVTRANQAEELPKPEKLRLRTFADEFFIAACVSFVTSHQSGALHDQSSEVEYIYGVLSENPCLAKEWNRSKIFLATISPQYCKEVETRISDLTAD